MHHPKFYQEFVEEELAKIPFNKVPAELYDPIQYMLSLGGKRLRPVLLLMSNELFEGSLASARGAALGIEVFHNFTLLHDDIMDQAPLRRSHPTVHAKWNTNVAILSGDTMFVKTCQLMMETPGPYQAGVMDAFLKTATDVCEGQQMDMNFETRTNVKIPDYIAMITLKTAVLIGCSMKLGALIAGAKNQEAERMYEFGKNLGIAFQLHDDILDLYGDEKKFGKQAGGDILVNKKTFLLLSAWQQSSGIQRQEMEKRMSNKDFIPTEKVDFFRNLYEELKVREKAESEMKKYFELAKSAFEEIPTDPVRKKILLDFADQLMMREN